MNKIEFNEAPAVGKNYRKLFFSSKPGVPDDGVLPELELILKNTKANQSTLEAYNKLCKIENTDKLPITFPYVLAGPLHLSLLSNKQFPLKGAGLLHLRNRITYSKDISVQDSFNLHVKTADTRFRPQGFEFDIISEVKVDNKVLWSCKSTLLSRGKFSKEDPPSKDEELFFKMEKESSAIGLKVPGNAGRAYAKICKDYNPIHLATPLAWLFGFKKSIAHGMWVSARALGELNLANSCKEFDLAFKGPVYTGSSVFILEKNEHFNVFCQGNFRPVILGRTL